MPELEDGETAEVQGSAANPYVMKNVGGVYSCSCPAWRHQSLPLEARSCKHLRALRGEDVEVARVRAAGADLARRPTASRVSAPAGARAAGTAPAVMLAHKWDGAADISGWWMSEKLDGVRAFWDGEQFLSRQGWGSSPGPPSPPAASSSGTATSTPDSPRPCPSEVCRGPFPGPS